MKTNIITVKFEDYFYPRTFNGKNYYYLTNENLSIGDIVEVPTTNGIKIARVSRINIPEDEIQNMKEIIKFTIRKLDTYRYLNYNEVVSSLN